MSTGKNSMADVFFTDLYSTHKTNLYQRLRDLLFSLKPDKKIKKNSLVALKIHFGEFGNTAYIRPTYVRVIVDALKELGFLPFLTDTNTLYAGARSNSVTHLHSAIKNGFAYSVTGAPLIIADGLRSNNEYTVKIDADHFKEVHFGSDLVNADFIIFLSHFKGHELSGFGGALKNISMGCATRKGKFQMHSGVHPNISSKKCIACGECEDWCKFSAIKVKGKTAVIDSEQCTGCGECIIICPSKAIRINWDTSGREFLEKMMEYCYGFHTVMKDRMMFINFIMNVTPECDC